MRPSRFQGAVARTRRRKRDGRIEYSEFAQIPAGRPSRVSSVPIPRPCPTPTSRSRRSPGAWWPTPRFPSPCASTAHAAHPRHLGHGRARPPRHGPPLPGPGHGRPLLLRGRARPPEWLPGVAERGGRRRELAWLPRSEPWYMHSFALTPRFVAIVDSSSPSTPSIPPARAAADHRQLPLEGRGARAARPDRPPRRRRPPRHGGGGPVLRLPSRQRYERGDRVVLDLCAHRDSSIRCAVLQARAKGDGRQALGPPPAPEIDPAGAVSRRASWPTSTSSFRGSTTPV